MEAADAERQQRARQHIFAVNGSSEFLNFVRVLLEGEAYNVTTTNFVPQTFAQVAALQPALIIVDLAITQQAGWALLEQLQQEAVTNQIPVVVTATLPGLLERVEADPGRYGGSFLLVKPFDIAVLLEAIHDLIGSSDA